MKTYVFSYRFSRNGNSWSSGSSSVKAETQADAMAQLKNKYPYVKDIKLMYTR